MDNIEHRKRMVCTLEFDELRYELKPAAAWIRGYARENGLPGLDP